MILIADSGSTKTDWRLINQVGKIIKFRSEGINPILQSKDEISENLNNDFIFENAKNIKKVFFYGAGCNNKISKKKMLSVFNNFFLIDTKISINSDLLAAARATCNNKLGIVCILGTGSNSCLFDGQKITDNVLSLGYVLDDKGAGSVLGRELLTDYFKRNLPEDLNIKFKNKYKLKKENLLEAVYKQPFPNRYLSSFSIFLYENIKHQYIRKLIVKSFNEFIDYNIVKYENYKNIPVNFVGSIAYYFSNILKEVTRQKNINVNLIIKKPIEALVDFHFKFKEIN